MHSHLLNEYKFYFYFKKRLKYNYNLSENVFTLREAYLLTKSNPLNR